jgi:chemotaxis protein MotB
MSVEGKSIAEQFEQDDTGNGWIVTFADMMTLILVFFILLYTLADYEDKAYRAQIAQVNVLDGDGNMVSVLDYATQRGRDPEPLRVVEDMLGLKPTSNVIKTLRPKIFNEMESMIESTDLSDSVTLKSVGDQINLQIDGRYLFDSGKAELKDSAAVIFNNLAQLFRENPSYRIAIRGHTDDLTIETVQFPSNWELSAVRATTVLRYFIQQGIDPERMSATGFADFFPLVPNDTPENRAKNRRVEFVLEKEKEN